jgi:hypothetical protein
MRSSFSTIRGAEVVRGDVKTAVHSNVLASDVKHGIREQKAYELHCFLGRCPAPHRDSRQSAIPKLVTPDRFGHGGRPNAELDHSSAVYIVMPSKI